ncbi:MAG: NADH-quinone oxidoreductase subunit L [Candidatus Njordarchaeales archaeon]
MLFVEYAWLVPLIPILLSAITLLIGKRTPREGGYFGVAGAAFSLILSVLIAYEVATNNLYGYKSVFTWLTIGDAKLYFSIIIDQLSIIMMLIVSLIATLIMVYSFGYMHGEEGLPRYFAEMLLFVGSMLILVMAADFLFLFVGWELVGVCSYLLIGFWYKRPPAASAAKKAFLTTRMGDIFMLAGIAYLYYKFGTLDILELNSLAPGLDLKMLTLVGVFIFIGAMGKSAQFPLMAWLWDAMEGPTTVSAILHSSTMVKAGVYLVLRAYPIISASPDTLLFVAYIGSFTAFIAATMALVEWDIKRVLAYSTISQIGYMMAALGVGGYAPGYLHLISHAFFKALLFLCAGSVVHMMHEIVHDPWLSRDMRYMGGLYRPMKITALTMLIASLALAGIFPLSGFWSKDAIIEAALEAGDAVVYWLLVITAFLTAFYIMRLWFNTFWGELRAPEMLKEEHHHTEKEYHLHESPPVMTVPLIILAGMTIILGGIIPLFKKSFAEFLAGYLEHYGISLEHGGMAHVEFHPLVKGFAFEIVPVWAISSLFALLGIYVAYEAYATKRLAIDKLVSSGVGRILYKILSEKYGLDKLYLLLSETLAWKIISRAASWFDLNVVDGIVNGIAKLGVLTAKVSDLFDRYIIDGIVNGIGTTLKSFGGWLRRIEVGIVQIYIMLIVIGAIFFLVLGFFAPGYISSIIKWLGISA